MTDLKAPFPWFGGKSRVADIVWQRFGDVGNYVEPFFGSGAVLLGRPNPRGTETVNDKDGFVCNFWRALQADPEAVAKHADWPVNENDLHARHSWLLAHRETLTAQLEGDPDYYDAKIAGWWVWGICCWIGSGWCSGNGPWVVENGLLVKSKGEAGISRQLPHLGGSRGVNRQLPHLGNAVQGVNRKRPHLMSRKGVNRNAPLVEWMSALSGRLENVRVCCGEWDRIMGNSPTYKLGLTAVFLDPPYSAEADRAELYTVEDFSIAHDARKWAIANGDNPLLRIALCCYEGEHAMPDGWTEYAWKTKGGYGSQGDGRGRDNACRERIWFSPHCLDVERQADLFEHIA